MTFQYKFSMAIEGKGKVVPLLN